MPFYKQERRLGEVRVGTGTRPRFSWTAARGLAGHTRTASAGVIGGKESSDIPINYFVNIYTR